MLETKFMCHFLVENLKLNFNFSVFIRNIKLRIFHLLLYYEFIRNSIVIKVNFRKIKKDLYVFDMIF